MIDKDPSVWNIQDWFFVLIMPSIGGFVGWYAKVVQGTSRPFNIMELIGEMVTSGFVGVVAFMVAQDAGYTVGTSAAISGVCGHMGTRILFLIEKIIEYYLKKKKKQIMQVLKDEDELG